MSDDTQHEDISRTEETVAGKRTDKSDSEIDREGRGEAS